MPDTEDTFSQVTAATSGPLAGYYLWSNAANWSLGAPPVDGDSVSTAVVGLDDLATLTVASMTLSNGGWVYVTGASLDVTSVAGTSGTLLEADETDGGNPVTVTVGTITGAGGSYGATGAGAVFLDQSAVDPGENYFAQDGGFTELSATPSSSSTLSFSADGTLALQDPGATNAFALKDVAPNDTLELPGSSVSNVSFGPGSTLSVTTDDGSFTFSNVTYYGNSAPTTYRAAFDTTTGLEAITFLGLDTFVAINDPLGDTRLLWSDAANWSLGTPPIDGDRITFGNSFNLNVASSTSYDDLAALTVASVILGFNDSVYVTGASLDVTSVAGGAGVGLFADGNNMGTAVTVTVGTIIGNGDRYGASDPGASFVDQSAVDAGETYIASDGGRIELSATPNGSSTLQYYGPASTFALQDPAATSAFALQGVGAGDVLELPGSSVSSASFGSSSLSITTNDGSYAFSNVTYFGPPVSYTAAFDSTTGLEAITVFTLDAFSQVTRATSGPLDGDFLWSNGDNWSLGLLEVVDGESVSATGKSYDDLAARTLSSLTLSDGGLVEVTGASLDVTSVAGTTGTGLGADAFDVGTPVTVTVGTITGTGNTYGAAGTGAIFVDQSAVDPGETYFAELGGFTELSATPSSGSLLLYGGADSTFALQHPAATNTFALNNVVVRDVLELPGSSASNVSFGSSSLSVTTNDGSYDFSNVSYDGAPPTGYSAAFDSTTGLEAITFLGPDTFSDVTAVTSGPLTGHYLWSNAANWSLGAPPVDGDSVSVGGGAGGVDDLAALTLTSLTLTDNGSVLVSGASLDVTSVTGDAESFLAAGDDVASEGGNGTPVTVTVGTITGTGGDYVAYGAGSIFVDQSATDVGKFYGVTFGGFIEVSATPSSSSVLAFSGPGSTFALRNPGAINTFALENAVLHDVLELPGSSVSNVFFGPSSLSVTTNDGTYAFLDFDNPNGEGTGSYSAVFDSTTGLEAITFLGLDTFSQAIAATSGPLTGDYLWSKTDNWNLSAPPIDGDSVSTAVVGYDDLPALTLANLTLSGSGSVDVTGASLDVTSVAGISGTLLEADAVVAGTPVTVTVGTITGRGGDYVAFGAGAIFVDHSAADAGETYYAAYGGFTELSATPSSSSVLEYFYGVGTFALQNPGTVNAFALENVAADDVLELPGSSVSSISFGSSSLNITTNHGSYAFSNVTYGTAPITGYSTAFDSTTGLEAITFVGLDTFSRTTAAISGPLSGDYLWSNVTNWSLEVPLDGAIVSTAVAGVDDLAALTLSSLTLSDDGMVDVTGASLDVTFVAGVAGTRLTADAAIVGTPVTVTVGTITGTGGDYGATGTGAIFVDQSAADPGETYFADNGGRTEVSATPSSSSAMYYNGAADTFALQNPGATNAFALNHVAPSDVLELPGSSVSNVRFGSGSLSITTNDGSYAFSNVTYTGGAITGYSAAFDPTTGLEAISFLGLDTFSQETAATSGPLDNDYLWSNADNWSLGVPPADGDGISTTVQGFDDLAALTVPSLTLSDGGIVDVTGAGLDVTSVAGTSGTLLEADEFDVGTPVTVTVGAITGTGGYYEAYGAGAVFVDRSAVDAGDTYVAQSGGFVDLSATPSNGSVLAYDGADSTFALQNPGATNAFAMSDAALNDVLELPGSSVSNVSFGPGSLSVTTNDGSYAFSNVTYQGAAITGYSAAFDSTTGLEAITLLCFCAGSLIRTPSGEVLVEDLAIGDAVVTWFGDHRPITWIGVGQVLATRGRRNAATPVMVRKGALADNVPHADLRVTKGHSLFIDGALIPVELLVNHRSIVWDDRAQEVSIYHIELASHDILVANSAPAESYRDDGNRWLFQNGNSAWEKKPQAPCAPVLAGGALVDRVWRRLLDRSGPRPGLVLTADADLHLLVDGQRLDHLRRDGSVYTFCLPEAALRTAVHIVSRAAAPDELGLARDPRVLGIALRNIIVLAGARHRIIEAADDRLVEGFHGHEPELGIRWTDGDASLPAALFDGFDGRVDLMLQVEGTTGYVADAEHLAIAA